MRAVVYPPIDMSQQNEWVGVPYGYRHPYSRVQGVLYLIGFWFAVFAVARMANSTLVSCLRGVRHRWTRGAAHKASGAGLSAEDASSVSAESANSRPFKEVQHFSRFGFGLFAVFLSVYAALNLDDAIERPEIMADPVTIPMIMFLGVLGPVLLLNTKMVTRVGSDEVLVALHPFWFQKMTIAFAEIRQCTVLLRQSLDPGLEFESIRCG